jgi:hypothetical protein
MAHVEHLSNAGGAHPALVLGGLGLLSAILSSIAPESVGSLLTPIGDLFLLDGATVHPVLLFAPVIAFGMWAYGGLGGKLQWAGAALAFIMTVLGWSASVRLAHFLYDLKIGASWMPDDVLIPGFAAGVVGAAFVFLGGALTVPVLRLPRNWGPALLIGGLAGLLLWAATKNAYEPLGPLCLFAVWQTSIAAWFGRGLSQRRV